jgi:hypothetical protein
MDSFSHDFTSSTLIVFKFILLHSLYPYARSAYDTYCKSDTYVRLHPDKQLIYCSIAIL